MFAVRLPDGNIRSYENALSVYEVAKDISNTLAKTTLAGKIDGRLVDASYVINQNCELSVITKNSNEALEIIRHSSAHLLAQAVKNLYPSAQVTIGPVIKDGFYYDFAYAPGFSVDNLATIEKEMIRLTRENLSVERIELSREEAIGFFKKEGENYKAEIIDSITESEAISLYKQGDFIDLCRGPHVSNTNQLKAFKLTKLAGAYWRGDANNEMLQRIYGTAWLSQKDLNEHLVRLQEAMQRDHRKIAKAQDLFHTQEEAPGMVFWHSKGWILYKQVENYMRQIFTDNGYEEVSTPQVIDKSLWQDSGHWDKFSEVMFTTKSENREYAIKPMNCPAHVQIYRQKLKSYKDLPVRLAEFGSCHRNEPSGTLHGLMRVRNFIQDDAHIFCSEEQIQSEVSKFIDLTFEVYHHFGFENIAMKLSTRPKKRLGSDAVWDKAEKALEIALNNNGLDFELQAGEGAFYGPKIEFVFKDCLNRSWQCGTLQVDFSMPKLLKANYIAKDGTKQTPVMLHRAILGSIERFIGILIEHYAGAYPLWLAPVQVVICNITAKQSDYVRKIAKIFKQNNIRALTDLRNEKIGFKIREHSMQRYPYIIVVGDKEVLQNKVTVRARNSKNLDNMSTQEFIECIRGINY